MRVCCPAALEPSFLPTGGMITACTPACRQRGDVSGRVRFALSTWARGKRTSDVNVLLREFGVDRDRSSLAPRGFPKGRVKQKKREETAPPKAPGPLEHRGLSECVVLFASITPEYVLLILRLPIIPTMGRATESPPLVMSQTLMHVASPVILESVTAVAR